MIKLFIYVLIFFLVYGLDRNNLDKIDNSQADAPCSIKI